MQASIDCGVKLNLQAQNQKSKSIIYIYITPGPLYLFFCIWWLSKFFKEAIIYPSTVPAVTNLQKYKKKQNKQIIITTL